MQACLQFAEREYLGRSQRYEEAKAKICRLATCRTEYVYYTFAGFAGRCLRRGAKRAFAAGGCGSRGSEEPQLCRDSLQIIEYTRSSVVCFRVEASGGFGPQFRRVAASQQAMPPSDAHAFGETPAAAEGDYIVTRAVLRTAIIRRQYSRPPSVPFRAGARIAQGNPILFTAIL